MRIALVITELEPGGAEKCLVNLASYLHQHGHEVHVFSLAPRPTAGREQLVNQLAGSQIPCSFGTATKSRHFLSSVRWLRKQLRDLQPDVVQSMLFHANLVTACGLPNGATFFGGARVRPPQRFRWWLQSWAAKKMKKLICVSQGVANHCIDHEHIASDKVVVIPNGIDLTWLDQQAKAADSVSWNEYGLHDRTPMLLFVGRLDEQKGIVELVSKADELLSKLPQHHLVLVGDGPLSARVRELAESSKFEQRIHIVGWQPNPIAWMARSQMLLLPARYEGMANVLLEAMAVGRPVVAFGVEGTAELFSDESLRQFQLSPAGDYTVFLKQVVRLACDFELAQRCGISNRLQIVDHFQLERQLATYEKFYAGEVA